jgi:thioester reductase-like protein
MTTAQERHREATRGGLPPEIKIGDFQTYVRYGNPVARDHQVHGVRLVPGLAYVDMFYRAAASAGLSPYDIELRDILFETPVAVSEQFDQRLRFRSEPGEDGIRIRIGASRMRGAEQLDDTEQPVAECLVARAVGTPPPDLDVASCRQMLASADARPMKAVYGNVERTGIVHRDFMRAEGTAARRGDLLVAEMSLGQDARRRAADFFLPPTFLDSAAVVAFSELTEGSDQTYVPVFASRIRVWNAPGDIVYLKIRPGGIRRRGDIVETGLCLYDTAGRPLVEYEKLTGKHVRRPELIERLAVAAPVARSRDQTAAAREAPPRDQRALIVNDLRALAADASSQPMAQITPDVGFYDLGLDSSHLLRLARTLEDRVGERLYPTLLFEYPSIDELADYLVREFGDRYTPGPAATVPRDKPPRDLAASVAERETEAGETMVFSFDWETSPVVAPAHDVDVTTEILVFCDDGLRCDPPPGTRVVWVRRGRSFLAAGDEFVVDPESADHLERLTRCLADQGRSFAVAVCLWGDDAVRARRDPADVVLTEVLGPFRSLVRGLARTPGLCRVLLACLPDDSDLSRACAAAIGGFARTARLEVAAPVLRSVLLDPADDVLGVALTEARADGPETEVRHAGGNREVRRLAPAVIPARRQVIEPGTVVLITGGLGGLGRMAARRFAQYGARLVLSGRREADARSEDFLRELEALGGQAVYVSADVSVPGDVARVVAAARRHFGPPRLVLHAAGVLEDSFVQTAAPDAAARIAAPKAVGVMHLERAVMSDALECMVLFSSLSAVVGNPGQSDYAAANRFLDAYAEQACARRLRGEHKHRTVSVGWPVWRGGGMQVRPEQQTALERAGFALLPDEEGLDLLEAAMADRRPYLAVAHGQRAKLARWPEFAGREVREAGSAPGAGREVPVAGRRVPSGVMDVAIVGISGRYPGAGDLDQFWRNLESGYDAITEVPAERWTPGAYPAASQRPLGRFGGFLDDIDAFDPEFFRIPPSLAPLLDPQERLFVESAYGAVENAGYAPHEFAAPDNRVGVFAAVTWGDYRLVGADAARGGDPVAVRSLPSSTANRVSYFFGFTGPSITVDTACSSSLTAVHLACRAITARDCTAAVAGGVNLILHPDKYLLLSSLGMTSADGRCRSFGAGGEGYGPAEGVGAVFLKPLDRAVADGDTIHAVIRGSAVGHGGHSAGYTVPHPRAQADVIMRALRESRVPPDTIGYIEAHGTGTALGDPVEVAGLRQAFEGRTAPCVIGSVKSSIGHSEAAAGIAALTKVVLQFRHDRITPLLHAREPNPEVDLAGSPFRLALASEPWPRLSGPDGELPRRAGISSFGAGGANAHLIAEEYIEPPAEPGPEQPQILVLSARSAGLLREYAERIARYLRQDGTAPFVHVARTLQAGRPALTERLALVADNAASAADALEHYLAGEAGAVVTATAGTGSDPGLLAEAYRGGDLWAAAELWVRGATPDWAAVNGGPGRRVPLPGYPLERRRFWVEPPGALGAGKTPVAAADGAVGNFLGDVDTAFRAAAPTTTEELDRCQPAVSHYAAVAIAHRFTEMGWPAEGGTVAELRDLMGIANSFSRFFDACLGVLARGGLVRRDGLVLHATGAAAGEDVSRLRDEILARFPESQTYIRLLHVCLESFPETLRGRKPATEVLFPQASLDVMGRLYRGNPPFDFYAEALAQYISQAARLRATSGRRPVRILEAGAGTGGATHAVLAALASTDTEVEYHCTDLGGSFVAHCRKTFGTRYPFTRFQVYDMEQDPAGQGLVPGTFDMVVAAGAVHAVTDVVRTASGIRQLLAPSGLLVLGEQIACLDVLAVTIGLLDGWHRYNDPERRIPHSPLLSVEGWRSALAQAGFDGFAEYGRGMSADPEPSSRIIVAANPAQASVASPPDRRHGSFGMKSFSSERPVAEPGSGAVDTRVAREAAPAQTLEPMLAEIVADCLGISAEAVRPDLPFAEYGMDSILAVAIIDRVNELLGTDLKTTVVYDYPTLRALAEHAAGRAAVLAPSAPDRGSRSPGVGQAMDIAIIGMSGKFPGASDYRELWRLVAEGRDCVTEVPPERWNVAEYYQQLPPAPGKTYSKWGGYLSGVDRFDPLFFGIVPAEADFMDPQQRLFLQESWKAIEDAGLDVRELRRSKCGIFVGATGSDYSMLIRDRGLFGSHHVFTGISLSILPARVAYHLDLTGPTLSIDTACSSSLVALSQACHSLATGESELALAGGVSVFVTPAHHQLASSLGMLSPVGRCKTFDDTADGFVIGEGAGVVLLKPLARALADGDPVHGVIKGIGVNQDGRTNGITAPSARSQADLERDVYERFGIQPQTIGYVEAHGTGTRLGDPMEIDALTETFRRYTDHTAFIPIGSVKSNIGHTSHAAGMAGLIKVLQSMRAGQIAPSLHYTVPNRLIPFGETPFFVNTELRAWPGPVHRAAISAFGFSGTNAHMVVEDLPDRREPTRTRSPLALVPLSARTEDSLRRAAGNLARFLADRSDLAVHDVAATLQLGRVPFGHRLAIIAGSTAELRERLVLAAAGQRSDWIYLGSVSVDERQSAAVGVTPDADLSLTARSWVAGEPLDFAGLYDGGTTRRVHLPGYVFAEDRCWLPDTVPGLTADERARQAVLAIAADELGVPAEDLDTGLPSDEFGFTPASRVRLLERLRDELGAHLPVGAFPVTMSLAGLADAAAGLASPAPSPTPKDTATAPSTVGPAADPELLTKAETYLISVLARQARLPASRIDARARLQDYGIESVLISKLTAELERDLGDLPKTLFFEYQTLTELAEYFVRERPVQLAALAGTAARPATSVPAAGQPADDKAADHKAARPPWPAADHNTAGQSADHKAARPPWPAADIAVIGMAGRYPMAGNNDEFWANLMAARDCVTEIPRDRWDHSQYLSDDPDVPGATYARWGGFIDDMDKFDARFFGITPKDAQQMDPQQRVFLEAAWTALEDGGYPPQRIIESARRRGTKDAGVFAGVTYGEYQLLAGIPLAGYWAVPNRVSYHFGFNGPSLAVDTACSGSLTAIHLACESLRRGECGYALAGGVNVSVHPGKFLLLGYGRWASSDGRCRTFGAGGDGYVPGEGVVALLLKPLADALEDGDRVYGVIRSSAVNHDGRTNGFSVPNPNAQADLVRDALASAGISARSVSYVEAHGTGTSLGDPIEVAALTKAYRDATADRGYAVIGSAKSCVGHLEAAAGAAGVVKTLLQFQHETIPPSQHADPPNPNIDFAGSPFRVALEPEPWPRHQGGAPRRAAVSSFGAGGANAHVVLEEPPAVTDPPAPAEGQYPVLLSARSPERLTASASALLAFLRSERGGASPVADIAWTLMVGRRAFEYRLALVVSSREELLERLGEFEAGDGAEPVPAGQRGLGESEPDREYLSMLAARGDVSRLADLWVQGWNVDWEKLLEPARAHIVSLPTYPFARDRYWIDPADFRRNGDARVPLAAEPPAPLPAAAAPAQPADTASVQDILENDVRQIFADLTRQSPDDLDVTADFQEFGFDSVVTVRMLNQLMKRYAVEIPATTIGEYHTIRSFSRHLIEAGLITAPPPVNGDARRAHANGGASVAARDRVPVAAARAPEPEKLSRDRPFAADSVFITGVTGVLGGKLLYDLLTGTSATMTCLVRGEDLRRATDRIRYFLGVYDPGGKLTAEFERRVIPLLGDVSLPRLGLDDATWDRLAAGTDVIIHAASKTTLVSFYEALAPTNVEGTRRVVDLALATRQKYLIYVSSFSALGDYLYTSNPPFTERDLELGQGYEHLPYQETKYHSEKLIRAASDQGLAWNIFRPGNIMGDAVTGRYPFAEVSVKGMYYDIFRTIAETGVSALTPIHWDISPVDYVSSSIIQLGLRRPSYRETYHLTNPDIRSLFDVSQHISEFGYNLRYLSIDEFHHWATERLFRYRGTDRLFESQAIEMIKYGYEIWGRDHYLDSSPPDSSYTHGILAASGIACPPIADLVPRYLRHCIEAEYLPAPPRRRGASTRRPRPAPAAAVS